MHVRQVLQHLLESQLIVKAKKCQFHVSAISFLGFVITTDSIQMDPCKLKAVEEWPVPTCRKQLQRFLGFSSFYQRLIL